MRSRTLPAWISWVGLVGAVGHLLSVNTGYYPASLMDVREMLEFFGWLLMVVWMLATGFALFRRAGSAATPGLSGAQCAGLTGLDASRDAMNISLRRTR